MIIVFDMDNTLTDEFGSSVRPGMVELLERLKREGHGLALWTNSVGDRARTILVDHNLRRFFARFVFREDYDPGNVGKNKDIRRIKGDVLIDDDPAEIKFVQSLKKNGFLISPFRKGGIPPRDELGRLLTFINKCGRKGMLPWR